MFETSIAPFMSPNVDGGFEAVEFRDVSLFQSKLSEEKILLGDDENERLD